MNLPARFPRGIVQCWGCGEPDAIHVNAAERNACRNGVARGVAEVAASHRRSITGCNCDCCELCAAARKHASLQHADLTV